MRLNRPVLENLLVRKYSLFGLSLLFILGASGCATSSKKSGGESPAEIDALKAQVTELNSKLEQMEVKFTALNDSLDAKKVTQENLEQYSHGRGGKKSEVAVTHITSPLTSGVGSEVASATAEGDVEAGFTQDAAVQSYRRATTLYLAKKFPESIVAFSGFIESYPDHPLAGSAQYYVGSSYYQQREYKLAAQEYQKVLTTYDRSSHVADTLRDLAETEDHLKLKELSVRHRQLLSSLFPQSPAAGLIDQNTANASSEVPAEEPVPTQPTAAKLPLGATAELKAAPPQTALPTEARTSTLHNTAVRDTGPPTAPIDPPPEVDDLPHSAGKLKSPAKQAEAPAEKLE